MEFSESLPGNAPNKAQITQIVSEALFFLYEQKALPSLETMQNHLYETSGHEQTACNDVLDRLIQIQYISEDKGGNVSFGTDGLWFLENSYMHGEELDSTLLSERVLLASKFFNQPAS